MRVGRVEIREVLQILRSTGGALHRAQRSERADLDLDPERGGRARIRREGRIRAVGIDPGDPLHEVEHPKRGLEAKVPALGEIFGSGWIEWELVRFEPVFSDAELSHAPEPEQIGESG